MRKFKGSLLSAFTWFWILLAFFPVGWMFFTSLKSEQDAATIPPTFAVSLNFDQYRAVWDRGLSQYMFNSAFASIASTILVLAIAVPAAYGLSIRPIRKVRDVLFFFISTRFLPVAAAILPLYFILKNIGMLDNVTSLTLLYGAMNLPIAVWMMRSFFKDVPTEIVEAGQVDGANLRVEITRIVLPIVAPGVAAVALISFIFAWNEYFLALILTSSSARTLPPYLASFVDGRGQFLAVLSAASTLAVLPVVMAGWAAQKQLVRGLAMGAVK